MKDIKFVRLADLYLIKDEKNAYQLCINAAKYLKRLNTFVINNTGDIELHRNVSNFSTISLTDLLFGPPESYVDACLSNSNIEANVLYMWQIMIADKDIQKTLNCIFSSSTPKKQKSCLISQVKSEFFKNLLRGYSSFTETTFENNKPSDVYHYFDKEIHTINIR